MTTRELEQEKYKIPRYREVYNSAVNEMTEADEVTSKYNTEPYCQVDEHGPTTRFNRASKICQETVEPVQCDSASWDSDDPMYYHRDAADFKENSDELKEMIEQGELVEDVSDPQSVQELAYHLAYNKTTSGEHDYESLEKEEASYHQASKLDYRKIEDARLSKLGFF